jgi:hypothetical protein
MQSSKDRLTLAQQLAATSEVVARLAADRCQDSGPDGLGTSNTFIGAHQQDATLVHTNRSTGGRNKREDDSLLPCSALPKLSFPKFHGEHPHIWLDKCVDYFRIFNIPECMWSTTGSLHMEDNAAKWMQVYKMKRGLGSWQELARAVDEKFGVFDYRRSLQDLLLLKKGYVEEYTKDFEALQFQVTMFNPGLDDMLFTTHFINGLKEEIKGPVQSQIPDSVEKANMLAKIHQQILDIAKYKPYRANTGKGQIPVTKADLNPTTSRSPLWKERQQRDYCRANNLCYFCGKKFDASHIMKCTKRPKTQVNALVVNDLGVELTEETIRQLEQEDEMISEMRQLSLNAVAGIEEGDSMMIMALVTDKAMLILIDLGSSHSFVSQAFLDLIGISLTPTIQLPVRVANGEVLRSSYRVPALEWWAHDFTFHTDMRVLDIAAYDVILGYDWLSRHNPMVCHRGFKIMEF